ncbi:mannitol dehydrogenase family protein [Kineococcus gypseus]|uniref:mannitol dehydrogenase family protein n=1 Tax=Kineococcus gypseus TaxID=1637102 RepID=UPI003D7C9DBD
MSRLTLDAARRSGLLPIEPDRLHTGIVHLGLGAFHRAHQAVHTLDAVLARGDDRWGICGVSLRSDEVRRRLVPQDLLYSFSERGPDARPARIIPLLRQVLLAGQDSGAVVQQIAQPGVHLVTLTVTEKGYHLRRGRLDLSDPAVLADLTAPAPRTPVGLLARGLQARHAAGLPPVTVLSCDNVPHNGALLRGLVGQFLTAAGHESTWLSATAFPDSMVDRITPATSPADLDAVEAELGMRDEAAVVAEPFTQWVVQDAFSGPRPGWEDAGVRIVPDVAPFEQAKLRILNATHSLLAYTGPLVGADTIAAAVQHPVLRAAAERMIDEDVRPTLGVLVGLDLTDYAAQVLRRFKNPALAHTTAQVGSDGSQKLPPRVLEVVRQRLAGGHLPRWSTLAVAAWALHVQALTERGQVLADPLAERLQARAREGIDALSSFEDVFGDLSGHSAFTAKVRSWYERLRADGVGAIEDELQR